MTINQYEIVLVNLEITKGSEIRKTRPCVVISPNEMNHNLRTIVIAPVTSTLKMYPTRVKVKTPEIDGMVAIDQIRTIDKQRIMKIIGNRKINEIVQVKKTIEETYVK